MSGDELSGPSGANGASTSAAAALEKLTLADPTRPRKARDGGEPKRHLFWETQPVPQLQAATCTAVTLLPKADEGAIDPAQRPEDVRAEPYNLPAGFEWSDCDMTSPAVAEEVYRLLEMNYVEDDDNMFRFAYSAGFLAWALQPPGYFPEWHVGVRVAGSGRLVAFISGTPAVVRARQTALPMAEINFLCILKKLRSKRLAPVLIKEVTRRVHRRGIWQASYTAGVVLPKPVATTRYWHRSLNPKKLIEVGFSRLQPRMTMARTVKLYKLPEQALTSGWRPMAAADVPTVAHLLGEHFKRYELAPEMSEADVAHWLLPRPGVVYSYVVADGPAPPTDFVSFYCLPSSIIGNDTYKRLTAAYCYYYAANTVPLPQLMHDALVEARAADFDVFNALDIMANDKFIKELKFGIGDGHLQYYLYNWRLPMELKPDQIGLVLL